MEEIWKEVPDLENYVKVSNIGNVYFLEKWVNNKWGTKTLIPGFYPKIRLDKDGYRICGIRLDGKSKTLRICRLVAKAFVSNPENLPCVNHKDENKTNDNALNLEWCDIAYNNRYGSRPQRLSESLKGRKVSEEARKKMSEAKKGVFPPNRTPFPKKPVIQYAEDGTYIASYPSLLEAAEASGIGFTCISKCCLGNQKRAGGFKWRYAS